MLLWGYYIAKHFSALRWDTREEVRDRFGAIGRLMSGLKCKG